MTGLVIGAIAAAILAGVKAANTPKQQPIKIKSKKKKDTENS